MADEEIFESELDDEEAVDIDDADDDVEEDDDIDDDAEDEGEVLISDKVADLVECVVCGLVDDADAVSLDVTDSDSGTLIEVSCAESDAGKVIGRKGRTIKAIRTIARALGQRLGTQVDVEVLG